MSQRASNPQRVLVVGGTGMLRAATLELCQRGHALTVVGRDAQRLAEMSARIERSIAATGQLIPVIEDWNDEEAFISAISAAAKRDGPFNAAIIWMHGERASLVESLARMVRPEGKLLHVLGSAAADPRGDEFARRLESIRWPCRYMQVILGFMIENGRTRWLAHDEISTGVLDAFDAEAPRSIVGALEPWSMHPCTKPRSAL